jgi:pimeloyl-ACP methyl ester carboxylesterase
MAHDPLNILIIHGMGDQPRDFSIGFQKELLSKFNTSLVYLTKDYAISRPSGSEPLNFIPGWWAPVMDATQKELERRIYKKKIPFLRKFGMGFMGDVVAYQGRPVYDEIHGCLAEALRAHLKTGSGHLTIIAHSLGSVIASDFVYDHTLKIGKTFRDGFGVSFSNFITLGSPLVLYAMRSANGEGFTPARLLDHFDRPVRVESETGYWLNLFDEHDIIGYPIKPVNRFYQEAVTADLTVDVGDFLTHWNPLSHAHYWDDGGIGRIIADKLAIDFAAIHLGLEGPDLHSALAHFRRRYNFL